MSRTASNSSTAWCVLKTSIQTTIIWSLALGIVPFLIIRLEGRLEVPAFAFSGRLWIGVLVFALASTLGLISAWIMAVRGAGTPLPLDPTRRLVVAGPYRWVRNPMAIAGLSQGIGVGLAVGSWGVLAYVAVGAVVWNWGVRPWEERDLTERFNGQYEEYRRNVRCWIVRTTPYDLAAEGDRAA